MRDKVWCSTNSGGVQRDWTGVPRQFRDPTLGVKGSIRCVCAKEDEAEDTSKFMKYDGCPRWNVTCYLEDETADDSYNKNKHEL